MADNHEKTVVTKQRSRRLAIKTPLVGVMLVALTAGQQPAAWGQQPPSTNKGNAPPSGRDVRPTRRAAPRRNARNISPSRTGTSISLDQAVILALANNPSIRAALETVRAAVSRRKAVSATWHPRVKLQVGYMFRGPLQQFSMQQQMDTPMGPMDVNFERSLGSYNNFNATIQAGWRAWDWGIRILAAKMANKGIEASRQGRKQAKAALAFAVRSTYLALLLTRRLQQVADFGVELATSRLRDLSILSRSGLVKELDVMRARSTLADRKASVASVRQNVRKLELVLGLLCGKNSPLSVNDRLDRLAARPVPRVRRLDLLPSVQAVRLAADAKSLSARMELRKRWPTLDLTAGASLLYPQNFFEKKWGPAYWAGVMLTWTLWDGLTHNRAADQARAEARKSRRQADAETRKIRQQLAADMADWRAAATDLVAALQRVTAAKAYLKAARAALAAGTSKPLDILGAEQAVLGAEASVAQARFARAMARARLLFHLGFAEDPSTRGSRTPRGADAARMSK